MPSQKKKRTPNFFFFSFVSSQLTKYCKILTLDIADLFDVSSVLSEVGLMVIVGLLSSKLPFLSSTTTDSDDPSLMSRSLDWSPFITDLTLLSLSFTESVTSVLSHSSLQLFTELSTPNVQSLSWLVEMECFFEGAELYITWFSDLWLNGKKFLKWKNIKNKNNPRNTCYSQPNI